MRTLSDHERRQIKRSEYNRKAYLKRKKKAATNDSDRRVLLSARIRDTILARIQRLRDESIATGRYGYKTTTEAIEDLVLRGMGTLRGDPLVDELMPYMDWLQVIDRLHRLRREAQSGLNKAREEIAELQTISAHDGATRVYHLALEAAHAMPPTEWRDWMITELARAFPELARRAMKGIDLDAHQLIPTVKQKAARRVLPMPAIVRRTHGSTHRPE